MTESNKEADLVDLSGEPKVHTASVPPSPTDNPDVEAGRRVLVQTKRSRELKFYIMLEVVGEEGGQFLGRVIGPEGYTGPRDTIYPSKYVKFEFDGLTLDDVISFEKKHVWKTI
jgi:hypothetical protein